MANNIEKKVEELLEQTINDLGYLLYDVEYIKEAKDYFLRIYIDKDGIIDLNDCEKVSDAISDILDEADYIKEQYFLEVSSPGIERVLRKDKHLNSNIGKKIQIKLYKPIEKEKHLIGVLKSFDENNLVLLKDEKEVIIPREQISLVKTVYNWE